MPAEITLEKAFSQEPYKSMITLLAYFQDEGLTLKEFQYALVEDHHLSKRTSLMKSKEKFDDILKNGKIKRYQPKFRKKSETEPETEPAIRIRNNLKNHLDRLKQKDWIYKDGMRYKLKIYELWQRHQNVEELMDYHIEQVHVYSLLPSETSGKPSPFHLQYIIYGFHDKILDDEVKKNIKEKLDKITDIFFELNALQTEKVEQYWQKKLRELKATTKSRKIRQMVNADRSKDTRIGYLFELFERLFKLESSDNVRFKALARVMLKATGEQWRELSDTVGRWILKFKEYKLNVSEIEELIEFAWKNKDFFNKMANKNIAFSTYWGRGFTPK